MTRGNTGGAGPVVASTRAELQHAVSRLGASPGMPDAEARAGSGQPVQAARVALVPTMGALHEGHGSPLDEARRRADLVVTSIFVNPLQFGPTEDLSRYPRTPADDLALCAAHGVDIVFTPDVPEIYPDGEPAVTVVPGPLSEILEGAARPGHFAGVLTVVAKLFGLVRPVVAVFGEKDYQQLVLIRQMVRELFLGVEVISAPTVREADGLALSSRNRYLTPEQRFAALAISRALKEGNSARRQGAAGVVAAARETLAEEPSLEVDYVALRSPDLSENASAGPARLLIAASVGSTRLIDNVAITLG